VLARQRSILLHLDVKEPGLDDEVARMLEAADMWDHVVALNLGTLPKLKTNPKIKLLRYKGGIYESRLDLDPEAVKSALGKPGQLLILEDPRLAAHAIGRPSYRPLPLPTNLRLDWKLIAPPRLSGTNFSQAEHVRGLQKRIDSNSPGALLNLLKKDDLIE